MIGNVMLVISVCISIFLVVFLLVMSPSVEGCGWFTYEDIPGTRSYYDAFDNLKGVEDSTLLMSRFPTPREIQKNVYIPMSHRG